MKGGFERGFVLVAVTILLVAAGLPLVASTDARSNDSLSMTVSVPEEYEFSSPTVDGTASVGDEQYDSVQKAVEAAGPGETVVLRGRFDERVVVNTTNLTLTSAPDTMAYINGSGEGDVLTLNGNRATVRGVWVANSGYDPAENDAAIWVNSSGAEIVDSRVTEATFGIWLDGATGAELRNNTIVGRERVQTLSYRGNGIQLWKSTGTVVENNRITDVRDGIYYSWADGIDARNNTLWDLRYGVHYMYSDDCLLENNTAFDNDVGYALMVSEHLRIVNNTAFENTGTSGHGMLLERIDHTVIRGNVNVGNANGLYVFNSQNNTITDNLLLGNDVGAMMSAGSVGQRVYGNSFVGNREPVRAVTSQQLAWNATDRGNYWSQASTVDMNNDGVSETRYRPAGMVEHLTYQHPQAAVFTNSPAFDAIRLAESSLPVVEAPGVVDHYPLTEPRHDWRTYYE